MKKILLTLGLSSGVALCASAQVYINELMVNAPGGDGTLEFFELRGSANMSLAGYYLISIEGQGTTGKGDVNQFVNLGSYSLGANGFLVGRQFGSPYGAVNPNATLLQPTVGPGWTFAGVYSTDGTGSDMENSATTLLLVNIGTGVEPTLTLDMDTEGDGILDVPVGWTIADSVGLIDSVSAEDADRMYGAVNIRLGALGSAVNGNLIQVPGTGTSLYVGRIGDSTGSTSDDWFGGVLTGTSPNFVFGANVSDPRLQGMGPPDLKPGEPNVIPEPASFSLLGLGFLGFLAGRKSKR